MSNALLLVIVFLLVGILTGFAIKRLHQYAGKIEKAISGAIYLLLLVLGISAGTNDKIMGQLHSLGLTALLISIFTVGGSVLLAWATYSVFFKKVKK